MEQINIHKMNEELMALKIEVAKMKEMIIGDLEFARDTEEAWQDVEEGRVKKMSPEDFLKEIKSFK